MPPSGAAIDVSARAGYRPGPAMHEAVDILGTTRDELVRVARQAQEEEVAEALAHVPGVMRGHGLEASIGPLGGTPTCQYPTRPG